MKRTISYNSLLKIYLPIICIIFAWWYIAFSNLNVHHSTVPFASQNIHLPIDRSELQKALGGDFLLMNVLMEKWNLSSKSTTSDNTLSQIRLKKKTHKTSVPIRLLPQTNVAATILLAIANHNEIIALPSGLRGANSLFSAEVTNLIPLDCESIPSEGLFQLAPDIVFIGDYSNSGFLHTLKKLKIAHITHKVPENIDEILATIKKIGNQSKRHAEAESLCIFIEEALSAIDRYFLEFIKERKQKLSERVLYLTSYGHPSLPDKYSQTWQLLDRLIALGAPLSIVNPSRQNTLPISIDYEKIASLFPESLLIAIPPNFQTINHLNERKMHFIDDSIQQSPTQFIVLAYYDLVNAVINNLERM